MAFRIINELPNTDGNYNNGNSCSRTTDNAR